MRTTLRKLYQRAKDFLFIFVNRKFLVFLFFFALSGIFWLIISLNETMEKEISIPVVVTNVPKGIIVTSEQNDTLRVTIRDKGYILAAYLYSDNIRPVSISLHGYSKEDGFVTLSSADLQKKVYQQLFGSSRITNIKPEKVEIYYNTGESKKVPVRFQGNITAAPTHIITKVSISPSNINILASTSLLDSIRNVLIEPYDHRGITDTIYKEVKLQKIRGVKFVPNKVRLHIYTDALMEKRIEVPIIAENMPAGKVLRTFPSRVTVKFVVGASQYNDITEEDFKVTVDYNELKINGSDKCTLHLRSIPGDVSKARIESREVDYLIEQQ